MSDKQGAPTLPPLTGGGGNNGGSNGGAPPLQQQQQQQQTVQIQQVFVPGLTTLSNVQQYVITSPVPVGQDVASGTTANATLSNIRFVNVSSASRNCVVNIAGSSGTVFSSPNRQNPTKLVLTTSPKIVRTAPMSNMFVTSVNQLPTIQQQQIPSSPPKKKIKLTEVIEKNVTPEEPMGYRQKLIEHKLKKMQIIKDKFLENAKELFFLHNRGNMTDYLAWKKKAATPELTNFLKQYRIDKDSEDESPPVTQKNESDNTSQTTMTSNVTSESLIKQSTVTVSSSSNICSNPPITVTSTLPQTVVKLSQQGGTPIVIDTTKSNTVPAIAAVVEKTSLVGEKINPSSNSSNSTQDKPTNSLNSQPVVKLVKLPAASIITTPTENVSNQEQIIEKAKQEAYVMQRVSELQRDGLWSEKRLPKVQEPQRPKVHWDYLLEEMVWLSTDFAQERKWKKSAAKKCARMVQKYFQEKAVQAQKAEKSEELRLKKIAGFIAKEIKAFWADVEKLVEYKQQTRLEEKRKKALDQHLNFIVDQTEKYSSWLTEGLNKPEGSTSIPASINSSRISSPIMTEKQNSDDEFEPNQSSDDDEETIAKAEEEIKSNHKEEIELLKKESELPLEDILKELPHNYLEERDKSLSPLPKENIIEENEQSGDKDREFTVASDDTSEDEEDTIMEQEKLEKNVDHKQELDDLKNENEMSIDELMAKYSNMPEVPMDVEQSDQDSDDDKAEEEEEETDADEESDEEDETDIESNDESIESCHEDSQIQSDEEKIGLKSLLEDLPGENPEQRSKVQNEMDDVAALAESIQPKGNTLLTTKVVTKVPFLLKHTLREYQHIGLDWLVTMFDRKLNGILADEMGLGKTIQTIALLAHLACEKGNWGPHLIIVPTSVMLNWEMEFKKWCPGFKILTYYGTQKERKLKRTGWTKSNAFHICITSYKLVIQDHQSFRRKHWKYLILDEAQNIKNFKSQRWQLLLNFHSQRRLLLTGTPLQNNLMELWSLMHFLMPNVFQSHREFKEWFCNPVTGMIEGNNEINESIIRRLHKVLRPFLLRRLKCEVEKQLPKKYEHVVMCRLSKRQRYLYDDFMSRAKTKETLSSGNLLSVINVLMQLRKVCNHPNLFEVRPTVSPFQMEGIDYVTASLAWSALDYDPFKNVDLSFLNLLLIDLEYTVTAFVSHRVRHLKTPRKLIEEIDSLPEPPPKCPSGKVKINVRLSNQAKASVAPSSTQLKIKSFPGILPTPRVGTSPLVKNVNSQTSPSQGVTLKVASGQQLQGFSLQLVPHQGSVKAIPVGTLPQNIQSSSAGNSPKISLANAISKDNLTRVAGQTITVKTGDSVQKRSPSFAHLLQTSTGKIIITPNQQNTDACFPILTASGQRLTVVSKSIVSLSQPTSGNKLSVTPITSSNVNRPVMRVPPLNLNTSQGITQNQTQLRPVVLTKTIQKEVPLKTPPKEVPKSEFYLAELEELRKQKHESKLRTISLINETRCCACPLYGKDLFETLKTKKSANSYSWNGGWIHCAYKGKNLNTKRQYFSCTNTLLDAIKSTEQRVEELKTIFEKFVVYVPAVKAPLPKFHVSHPSPHKFAQEQRREVELQRQLSPKLAIFHPIIRSMSTLFPDPRLIQYDCGKLQSLDILLRKLKPGNHRALIFTQMSRMLDVLEAFLNYHGYIYLRLDGATKIEQRQILMERFNNDKRIFCFILSTRSGGIGINLTGADTVIFYDSDWNPTMDAQAQDRCHRIGQTRDVHIYRLISERTIEENILKKANQKRLLGDLAIEGGNFTTAYFKSSTIQDLFNVDQTEEDASARMADILEQTKERERNLQKELQAPVEDKLAVGALESALASVEEDLDVQAAKTAKAEAVADLAEFDENIPIDDAEKDDAHVSKAEQEVQLIVSQLKPIERYAMKFVEDSDGTFSAAQLAAAEREIEEQKKEWELDRLKALKDEEERQRRLADEDSNSLTFAREDAQNQVWLSENTMEQMPMWCPPTPPTSDNDVYIDYSLGFLYDNTPMTETQLPPIYVKKEHKRCRLDPNLIERDNRRPVKVRNKEESVFAPRSLFDRQPQALSKMRRDMKLHKYRSMMRAPSAMPGVKSSPMIKSGDTEHTLEWLIHEDWALLQAIQSYQGLPLNLMIQSPGHTPNWDLVADIVNNTSRIYRSPKQCRSRYESIIVPREEGKLLYDITPKKQKKQKGLYKLPQVSEQQTKTNRPMRTSQLYNQDKNNTFSSLYFQRFDAIKVVSNKRAPTVKSLLVNPSMKNPKHAELLDEYNIRYETPLAPIDVATRRAERIAKEKMKNAASILTAEQQAALRLQQQQQQQHSAQQTQHIIVTTGSQVFQTASTVAGGMLGNVKTVNTIVASTPTIAAAAVKARTAGVQSTTIQSAGTSTSTVVTMASLHPNQRIANASLTAGQNTPLITQKSNLVGVTMSNTATTKLTPAQLQYARQQQQLRQQQVKNLQQGQAVISGQKMAVAVTATTPQRASLMKQVSATGTIVQNVATGKQATISQNEMAAILKRQGTLQQTKGITQVQVAGQTGMVPAQIYAQAGLQIQQAAAGTSTAGSPVATLVKGVRATTPQQIRQLQLQTQLLAQRKIPGQKVAQLAQITNKTGVPQFVVQQKAIPNAMTVQQIHQVMKQVPPGTMQQFAHVSAGQAVSQPGQVILAKSPIQQRVIPVASTGIKQTIQVVSGSPAQIHHTSPVQSNKTLVSTPRASPGPNQMRIQTQMQQPQTQQTQGQSNVTETQK